MKWEDMKWEDMRWEEVGGDGRKLGEMGGGWGRWEEVGWDQKMDESFFFRKKSGNKSLFNFHPIKISIIKEIRLKNAYLNRLPPLPLFQQFTNTENHINTGSLSFFNLGAKIFVGFTVLVSSFGVTD